MRRVIYSKFKKFCCQLCKLPYNMKKVNQIELQFYKFWPLILAIRPWKHIQHSK